MSPEIERLLVLRGLDADLFRLQNKLHDYPRREKECRDRLAVTQGELEKHKEHVQQLSVHRREGESKIGELEEQERKFESRTVEVKTNEELRALRKEIEDVQAKRSELETVVLSEMEEEEGERSRIAEFESAVQDAQTRLDRELAEINGEKSGLEGQIDDIEKKRKAILDETPATIRSRYDRVYSQNKDSAIVSAVKNSCGGCLTALPPQRVQEVKIGEQIVLCEFLWPIDCGDGRRADLTTGSLRHARYSSTDESLRGSTRLLAAQLLGRVREPLRRGGGGFAVRLLNAQVDLLAMHLHVVRCLDP